MTKEEVKHELKQCSHLKIEIKTLIEITKELIERKRQKLDLQAMILTDMPNNGTKLKGEADKIGNTLAQIEELEEYKQVLKYEQEIDRVKNKIKRIEHKIEKDILLKRYILGKSWKVIAYELRLSEQQIYTYHGRALVKYSNI